MLWGWLANGGVCVCHGMMIVWLQQSQRQWEVCAAMNNAGHTQLMVSASTSLTAVAAAVG